MSFLTYDTADDIITSLEIIEKLLFPETDFWHNNYLNNCFFVIFSLLDFLSNLKLVCTYTIWCLLTCDMACGLVAVDVMYTIDALGTLKLSSPSSGTVVT